MISKQAMEMSYLMYLLSVLVLVGVAQGDVSLTQPEGSVLTVSAGTNANFQCHSMDGQDIEWIFSSSFGDITLEESQSFIITSATRNGMTDSYLTIEGVTTDEEGSYLCRGTGDGSESERVRLIITDSLPDGWVVPHIERRSETQTQIEVEIDTELRLKCTGGAMGSNLEFKHDGQPISTDTQNFMTPSEDMSGQHILILTRKYADVSHSGTYTCEDASYPEVAEGDRIEVVVSSQPAVLLEITEPSSSLFKTLVGDRFTLKCQAGSTVSIKWYFNQDTEIESEVNGFIITKAIDTDTQIQTAILTKDETSQADEGEYSCVNDQNPSDSASVELDVRVPGEEEKEDGNGDDDDNDDDGLFDGLFGRSSSALPSAVVVTLLSFCAILWF